MLYGTRRSLHRRQRFIIVKEHMFFVAFELVEVKLSLHVLCWLDSWII